ncbi:MAG: hypothetical protein GY847_25240 [Proteobacteria bacterium]|nr:hypothetical protein [Pseudomonadota bacterium]
MTKVLILLALCILAASSNSCIDESDACDDGWVLTEGKCQKAPADTDEEDGDEAVGEEEAGEDSSDGLGEACKEESDCTGDADYCAINPMAGPDSGYCTHKDCTEDPDSCPQGYRCLDMSMLLGHKICLTDEDYQAMGGE